MKSFIWYTSLRVQFTDKYYNLLFLSLFILIISCSGSGSLGPPQDLRVEYKINPLGVDNAQPRFSWEVNDSSRGAVQSAWQILVANSLEHLNQNIGNVWDSGKIDSNQNIQVHYKGPSLESGQRFYWKVRTWDKAENSSSYSKTAWWETGLLNEEDWKANWIFNGKPVPDTPEEFYEEDPNPLFRKEFTVEKPMRNARLYISGLGYYEALLNGRKVGDRVLEPGWTNYGKTVYYSIYDVQELLNEGRNALGVMLGNGWYNPLPMELFGNFNLRDFLTVGRPKLMAQLNIEYQDGTSQTITTDESWKVGEGPILKNDVYLGEYYDARLEESGWDLPDFDDKSWQNAQQISPPGGELTAQIQPPVKITKTLTPVGISETEPGIYIVDMGRNFAGWIRMRAEGPAGTKIKMRYGELLNDDGTLNGLTAVAGQIKEIFGLSGGPGAPKTAWQEDTFVLSGDGEEEFRNHFTFHGFRYVEVKGYPGEMTKNDIEGLHLNAELEKNGIFSCSNPMFNELQDVTEWTFLSNVFSVQSDCPHREKFGYGGDIVTAAEAYIYNYNMGNFFTKAVRDFARDVRPNGGMPETAPYNGIDSHGLGQGSGPIGWQYAHPFTQMKLYQFYGDTSLIREQYPATKKLIEFLRSKAKNHIIDRGISDHATLEEKPIALTSTAFYYDHARLLSKFAEILGKTQDQETYAELAEEIKRTFIDKFYNQETGLFSIGNQTTQAFALYYDLVPKSERNKVLNNLIRQIEEEHNGHIAAGIFGTKMIFDVLRRYNQNEVAYKMANKRTFPGWGYMLENDATTLWEFWRGGDNAPSHNHPMFGSISEWFYRSLAGINPHPESTGFDRIIIRPLIAGDLSWAEGKYKSVRGTIRSRWSLEEEILKMQVTLPANTSGEIHIPTMGSNKPTILENGTLLMEKGKAVSTDIPGIRNVRLKPETVVVEAGSGSYNFELKSES